MTARLSVSIVTYNSELDELRETIESTLENIDTDKSNLDLVNFFIIDNASSVSYQKSLKTLIDGYKATKIRLVQTNKNIGFGQGHNTILNEVESDYHMVLNPDVTFMENSLIEGIQTLTENERIGLVLPTIYNDAQAIQLLHGKKPGLQDLLLRSIAPTWLKKTFQTSLTDLYNIPSNTLLDHKTPAFFSGCCMLFRTDTLKQLEGFSKKYFLYFEDYDLALRLLDRSNAFISTNFKIIHKGGNTHKKSVFHWYHYTKSMLRYLLTNY